MCVCVHSLMHTYSLIYSTGLNGGVEISQCILVMNRNLREAADDDDKATLLLIQPQL